MTRGTLAALLGSAFLAGLGAGYRAWHAPAPAPPPAPLVAPAIYASLPRDLRAERDSMVVRIARDLHLDPTVALAVAYVENPGADSQAISRAGAVGLMQVMPPAALAARGNLVAAEARARLIEQLCGNVVRLVERACNIRVGLHIYADYLRAYHGNERRALIAYNGALAYPRAAARYVAAVRFHIDRLSSAP